MGTTDGTSTWPAWPTTRPVLAVPDGATDACSDCGEYLYGEDESYGPYLSTGAAVFCYDCAGRATRGVR